MLKHLLTSGVVVVGILAFSGTATAAPLTCPLNDPSFNRYYTVDPATACVYGGGQVNNALLDAFLSGPIVAPPADGIWGGVNLNAILNGFDNGADAGWEAVDYDFGDDPQTDPNWSIPGFDPLYEYLVGIKDGDQSPGWALFLVTASGGTWSTIPDDAFSHGLLYRRLIDEEPPTEEPQEPAPEPASLALFGLALMGAAYRRRRKSP